MVFERRKYSISSTIGAKNIHIWLLLLGLFCYSKNCEIFSRGSNQEKQCEFWQNLYFRRIVAFFNLCDNIQVSICSRFNGCPIRVILRKFLFSFFVHSSSLLLFNISGWSNDSRKCWNTTEFKPINCKFFSGHSYRKNWSVAGRDVNTSSRMNTEFKHLELNQFSDGINHPGSGECCCIAIKV